MKYWKLIPAVLMVIFVAGSSQAEEKSAKKAYAEKVKTMEDGGAGTAERRGPGNENNR